MNSPVITVIGLLCCIGLSCTSVEEVGQGEVKQPEESADSVLEDEDEQQNAVIVELPLDQFDRDQHIDTADSTGNETDVQGPAEDGNIGEDANSAVPCDSDEDCAEFTLGICEAVSCQDGGCIVAYVEDGTPCDDELSCTTDDQCFEGLCDGISVCECLKDDDCVSPGSCIVSSCNDDGDCVHDPLDEGPCNDGDLCTSGDSCSGGLCTGELIEECSCEDSGITMSSGEPACSIAEALDKVEDGGTVSLSSGTFAMESLEVNKPLSIVGAGLGETEILVSGTGLTVNDVPVAISGVQFSGGARALVVSGSNGSVALESSRVQGYGDVGIFVSGGTLNVMETIFLGSQQVVSDGVRVEEGLVNITGGFIQNHGGVGVMVSSGTLQMSGSASIKNNKLGGIKAENASLILADVVVQGNWGSGLNLMGGTAQLSLGEFRNQQGIPGHGIWTDNSNVELKGTRIYNNNGHGLLAVNGETHLGDVENTESGCEVTSNQNAGVVVEGSGLLSVHGGTFSDNEGANIRLSGGSLEMLGAHVYQSKALDIGHGIHMSQCVGTSTIQLSLIEWNAGHGVLSEGCDVALIGNTGIRSNGLAGVKGASGSILNINSSLQIEQNGVAGVWFANSTGSIRESTILGAGSGGTGSADGIILENANLVTIYQNQITGLTGFGVRGEGSGSILVEENIVEQNVQGGLQFTDCESFDIVNNTLSSNSGFGMFLHGGNGNISTNTVVGSLPGENDYGTGVHLKGAVDGMTSSVFLVTNNVVEQCSGVAFVVEYATLELAFNEALNNGMTGFLLSTESSCSLSNNMADGNGGTGFVCASDLPMAACVGNTSLNNEGDNQVGCDSECFD